MTAVLGFPAERFGWLPEHLLRPGWGGAWMVALVWLVVAWPGVSRTRFPLARRLQVASLLALLGLGLHLARVPVELERRGREGRGVVLPRGDLQLDARLPAPPESCRLGDLAPVLAAQWACGASRGDNPFLSFLRSRAICAEVLRVRRVARSARVTLREPFI